MTFPDELELQVAELLAEDGPDAESYETATRAHQLAKLLATAGSQDGDIILWDFASGQKLKTLEPRSDRIWQVAFHPDFKTLAETPSTGILYATPLTSTRSPSR